MSEPPLSADELDINLRLAPEVGARILILAALCQRAYLETADPADDPAGELFDLRGWLVQEELLSHATPEERWLLEAPLGQAGAEAEATMALAAEPLSALAWAAHLLDAMPPYAEFASPEAILARLPAPWDATASFIAELALRPEDVVATERERAELWAWRAGIADERRAAGRRERDEIDQEIAETIADVAAAGLLPTTGRDLAVAGRPFPALPPDTQDTIGAIAAERLHALNWLCGFGAAWDDVPLDV
jgi:hypothetical protein